MVTRHTGWVTIPRTFSNLLEPSIVSHDLSPRIAPPGMTLPVPRHVKVAGTLMGAATFGLGLVLLLAPPRPGGALDTTVLQLIRQPLGWAFLLIGLAVVCAHVLGAARASVHGVAAVAHVVHCVALFASVAFSVRGQFTVASTLSLFAWVAHGGCSLDYWKRGYR